MNNSHTDRMRLTPGHLLLTALVDLFVYSFYGLLSFVNHVGL